MSKKLLEEVTIRKFMKLAGTQPLADGFVARVDEASGKAGDMSRKDVANIVPAGSRWLKEEEEIELDEDLEELTEQEEELGAGEDLGGDLGGMEDLGAEEAPEEEADEEEAMEAEAEVEGEEGEVTLEPEEAEVLKGVLEKLISAMGDDDLGAEEEFGAEEDLGAEEELGMGEEDLGAEEEPEEMMEALVKRISARVAKRLLEIKK